jgi:glyoxylase-like metal-dependent hydrolase (beta-lactamase superfamily II)
MVTPCAPPAAATNPVLRLLIHCASPLCRRSLYAGTNCYLVGTGEARLLIDTGEAGANNEKMLASLEAAMRATGCKTIEKILLTHMHHDHFGGVAGVQSRFGPGIPIFKFPSPPHYFATMRNLQQRGLTGQLDRYWAWQTASLGEKGRPAPATGADVAAEADGDGDDDGQEWRDDEEEEEEEFSGPDRIDWDPAGRTKDEIRQDYWFLKRAWEFNEKWAKGHWGPCHRLADGELIRTEGATLMAMHTPGHSEDHGSFLVQEDSYLFSGDQVLGWGTTFQMDLHDYMSTLYRMLAAQPSRLLPGHGPPIDDSLGFLTYACPDTPMRSSQFR